MAGAKKVFNIDRQKEVIKQGIGNPFKPWEGTIKTLENTAEDLGTAFTPDTTEQDRIAQETLDLMRQEAEKPAIPMPDEHELRRARRRRGQPYSGRMSTVLTDRLGG